MVPIALKGTPSPARRTPIVNFPFGEYLADGAVEPKGVPATGALASWLTEGLRIRANSYAPQFLGKLKIGNTGRKPFSAMFRKPNWKPVISLVTLMKPS